jgi:hypothetical protein
MAEDIVDGGLFIRNYGRLPHKLSDSERARRRILRVHWEMADDKRSKLVTLIQSELGVDFPFIGTGYSYERFWTTATVADFLSAVTLLFRLNSIATTRPEIHLERLRRIFSEENLRYRLDNKGGVHFLVDEKFEQNAAAAMDGLGLPKFEAARHELERALDEMSKPNPSGKALIKGVFEAVESTFLAKIQPAPAAVNILNEPNVLKYLRPILEARYAGVPEANDKLDRVLEIHKAWVKAAHPFRHGVPFDQIHEAPLDYAILLADQGMAFLRFIVAH